MLDIDISPLLDSIGLGGVPPWLAWSIIILVLFFKPLIFNPLKNALHWKWSVDRKLDSHAERIGKVEKDINGMQRMIYGAFASKGPRTLSKLGKRIARDVDAGKLAASLASQLNERTRSMSAYLLQEFCFEYADNEFKPTVEIERKMQDCAYENGVILATVRDVIAVALRDTLLSRRETQS